MIREWIQNIVVYLLCMSLVHHLIPDESYGKYIRLGTGMILNLILVMPVIQWLDLEDVIDETFFQNQLQNYADDVRMSAQLLGAEQRYNESFKKIISDEIKTYFQNEGMNVKYCQIDMNEDMNDEHYGKIYSLCVGIQMMDQALMEKQRVSEIEIQRIDIGKERKQQEKMVNIPETKVKEWKENLSIQFGVKHEQLTLEILS